jgi:CubicO group peptidase (beta-lactamase class C family)
MRTRPCSQEAMIVVMLAAALFCSAWSRRALAAADVAEVWPVPDWQRASSAEVGMDEARLREARDYALKGDGSGFIVRHGRLVFAWGDPKAKYDLKSTTKSFGATALALAVGDGKIALEDLAVKHHPQLAKAAGAQAGWGEKITILHLATQTAGFEKPGGSSKLLFEPGTKWAYSDSGPNWLAECVTLAYRRDVADLMFERVFTPLGIQRSDLTWRNNAYRPARIDGIPRREFGSGISANVDAMARFGLMYLRGGRWQDRRIIPKDFVERARTTPAAVKGLPMVGDSRHAGASHHYGLLWWNNNDTTLKNVPADAYWSWGLGDSFVFVIPSLDVVVTRAGKAWPDAPAGPYAKLAPFLDPIVASIKTPATSQPQKDQPPSESAR